MNNHKLKEILSELFKDKVKMENINIVKKFDSKINLYRDLNEKAKSVRDLRTKK